MRESKYLEIERLTNEYLAKIDYFECIKLRDAYLKRLTTGQIKLLGKRHIQKNIVGLARNEISLRIQEGGVDGFKI